MFSAEKVIHESDDQSNHLKVKAASKDLEEVSTCHFPYKTLTSEE
jgi:hypothetical protein